MNMRIENKIVITYAGLYILLIAIQVGLLAATNINWNNDQNLIRFNSIANLSFYGIMALLFVVMLVSFWKKAFAQFKQNKWEYIKLIGLGFLTLIAVSMLMNVIYSLLGITDTSDNQEQLNQLLEGGWFDQMSLVLFAVFLAPMVEEMVFRLAGFNFLMRIKVLPSWAVVVITSLIFGFIHVMGSFDLEQIFYYAGLGVVLGYFYYRSKNIIVPIVIHMLLNGFVTFSMFFLY
ncbi:CAAX amino terminal protease self- immunity [Candidatus Izimaplasma bacterium HR1]|jgi:membrane protease YdiL (CAAX protease family)|uniref:CPBP family intramembrane glutamic endopeptidase n=1 Tax=Candidatus Izimoplasma sp. HR1 TaxID=1541959 RepID=UPI0004F81B18|nr:CAAX amino terminal protease self- immunity [Candidatus Izimaplasma bacterium HR1]